MKLKIVDSWNATNMDISGTTGQNALDVLQCVSKVNVAVTPPRVSVMMEARIVIVCPIGGRAYIKRNWMTGSNERMDATTWDLWN